MVRVLSEKSSTRKNLQLHFDNLQDDIAQVASEHDICLFHVSTTKYEISSQHASPKFKFNTSFFRGQFGSVQ